MMGLKKILVLLGVLALFLTTGCAEVLKANPDLQVSLNDLHEFVGKDLDAAIARAAKATDVGAPYRSRCYVTLKKYLPDPNAQAQLPAPVGIVDAFELAAEVDAKLAQGGPVLPPELEADCSYVISRIRAFVLRNAAKVAPVPGLGAVAPLLK